jgi:hypothetical protein
MASAEGPSPLLYPIKKGNPGHLAPHQETSLGNRDALPFPERLFRGLTLLSQKDPVGSSGFPCKEIMDTFSMIPSMCHHWCDPTNAVD